MPDPDFVALDKPRSKKQGWLRLELACAAIVGVYSIFPRSSPTDTTALTALPSTPGWDELVPCSDTISFDDTKTLELLIDQKAFLSVKEGDDSMGKTIEGRWTFDRGTKRYAVTFNGITSTYSIVSPPAVRTELCILVAGDIGVANLRASWFSYSSRMNDESD